MYNHVMIAAVYCCSASLAYGKCTLKDIHFDFYWQFVQAKCLNQTRFVILMRTCFHQSELHVLIKSGRKQE